MNRGPSKVASDDLPYDLAASAMQELLRWVTEPATLGSRQRVRAVHNRALALAWAINPDSVGGISMTELSRRIGVAPQTLAAFTGRVRRQFALRNRYHAHINWRIR